MIRQRRHPGATLSTTRLEAFTDGVFAIAATLLVLDLTTHSIGEVTSDGELWTALTGMWELFLNFVISFVLLVFLWMIHVRQFEFIVRVDAMMTWLNNGRLLFIVLVPFSTSLMTEYSEYFAGRMAMPVTFFGAVLFSWLQWEWARRRIDQFMPDHSPEQARDEGRAGTSALIIAAVIVAISPWAGSYGFLLFFLDPLLTRLLIGRKPVPQDS